MIVDVHCHVGYSARRVDDAGPRFSFEAAGSRGTEGFDGYFSPRMLKRTAWYFVKSWLKIDPSLGPGATLDAAIEAANERHFSQATSVDRLVLLAFDEYHDDNGVAVGQAASRRSLGSDLYVSNSLVRAMCDARPDRFLFGASIHPYRVQDGRDACAMLEEDAGAKPALVKWLPIHQNIRAEDPRTVAFLRKAAELGVAMLIHYGGEMSLSPQHREFEDPRPMLGVLRGLLAEGVMPTVIVAHAATPSFRWQSRRGHDALIDALLGEFADAPLYADIAALAAFGRTSRLCELADAPVLHSKLVWGSDFPIPVMRWLFWRRLPRRDRRRIAAQPSWIEQSILLSRALGLGDRVFEQAARVLGVE